MVGTILKYFAFGGSYSSRLKHGMAWSVLNAFFEALRLVAFAAVLVSLVSDEGVSDETVSVSLGVMLMSILGSFVTAHFKSQNFCDGNYSMTGEKRMQIGDRMRYLPMGYFSQTSLGEITSTMTNTLDDVQNAGGLVYTNVISGLAVSAVMAVMIIFMDWRCGLVVVATIACTLGINALMQKSSRALSDKRVRTQRSIVGAVLEYVRGMSVVRAFSLVGDAERALRGAIFECERVTLAVELRFLVFTVLEGVVTKVSSIGICLLATWCWINGTMETSTCLMMIVVSFMAYGKLELAGQYAALLRQMDASMDKVNDLIATPALSEGRGLTSADDLGIRMEDVTFSYGDQLVIDHVSLSVPAGTTCALVGPSGSGKTTISQLMARFWDVDSGSVTLGGVDVRDWGVDALLSNFSMVFQGVYLFDDTIESNIKFGRPEATHAEVVDAARRACCSTFIEALPDGYQTRIGEGGASLSGGERQRVSVARAILKDAPIVILDEATANVDPENERDLQLAIAELTRSKTVVVIAHRLKTVRDADQILVVDAGRVVQRGTHDELMRQGGVYRDFVSMRTRTIGWRLGGRAER